MKLASKSLACNKWQQLHRCYTAVSQRYKRTNWTVTEAITLPWRRLANGIPRIVRPIVETVEAACK